MNTVYGHILNVSPMWGPMQYINSDAGQGKRLLAIKKVTLERLSYTHFLAIFLLIDQSLTGFEPW